ncbi:hypothetical protein H7F15_02625 [Pontibacter sp. Tf4]|uniref:hypothetical protein n=1 Tax=Pontibacter sp. Tf4 TaxID=2761620 RepID=UPI0016233988|nr:hypothetical protein [Pontibacter sp. Tf4]MBB6609921.1 hypothetical protein [Pontibacter sp. Tf4]
MANYNEEENQRIGRDLHRRDMEQNPQQHPQRYGYRAQKDQKWNEGNYFHTGPSRRGAQDRENMNRNTGNPQQHGPQHRGEGAHLNDHYGSRPNSTYRNERSYLDHGDSFGSRHYGQGGSAQQGNYSNQPNDMWRDTSGERSSYKETDARYGSGTHNWYTEGRFTRDETPPEERDNRGFFSRLKDTWNDIMHSDDPDYRRERNYPSSEDRLNSRRRYGTELYNRQQFERGYEGGPRWADETDSGRDNYYDDIDRTQRYRR